MISTSFTMASLVGLYPEMPDAVNFILIGFSVVMVVLALLWFLTSTIGLIFAKKLQTKKSAPVAAASRATASAVSEQERIHKIVVTAAAVAACSDMAPPCALPEATMAVIQSAVAQVFDGQQCRVVSIREVN